LEPKESAKHTVQRFKNYCRRNPAIVGSTILTPLLLWAGSKILFAIDDSFFEPAVLLRNSNITNPDIASL
jgi:hypothetical protein